MPRQARLIVNKACYHVMTRGNQKQVIFRENADYKKYLSFINKYRERYKFKIYGWCLMKNHVHLVLESDLLGKVMHGINLSYAQYSKHKYGIVGHFWQDRYKSYVIQKDSYLINCISYIEYNPIRAEIASRPEDYEWSSYKARILGKEDKLLDGLVL